MKLIVFPYFLLFSAYAIGQGKTREVIVSDTVQYFELIAKSPNSRMVDVENYVAGIKYDIRFALNNNPATDSLYATTKVFVREPLAMSLGFIQQALNKRGLGLKIFDAYRPYSISLNLKEKLIHTKQAGLIHDCEKHSHGASVDVSLISLETGDEIQMPSGYFQVSEATQSNYKNLPENVIENREILIQVMQQHGFQVSPDHWWHFDFMGWQGFSLLDLSIEKLEILEQR